MSELSNVVGSVAVQVLHTVGTGSRVELATSRLVIIGVEHKLQIIEAHLMGSAVHLMITPEVGIGETGQHHGSLQAAVNVVEPHVGAVLQQLDAKGFLQVNRRIGPVAPSGTVALEASQTQVTLERVLSGPNVAVGSPTPSDKALSAVVVVTTEDVLVVLHERAAAVVNHFLGILGGHGHVITIDGAADTSLHPVNLGQQTSC